MELMLVQRPPRLRRSPDVVVDGPFPGSRRAPTPGQPPTHLLPPGLREVCDLSEAPDAPAPTTHSVEELESLLRAMPPRQGRRDSVLEAARALARLDRARVLPFADALLARSPTDDRHRLGRALQHFPVEGQLSARLDALGVTPARPLQGPEALTVPEELQRRGRLDFFGNEADREPIAHDLLLYELAALAPGLEEAEFNQEAPVQAAKRRRFYRLHAYLGGQHHTLEATDYREYIDVESCIALVNALLASRGSDWRLAQAAPRDDWAAYVVAGPREALLALDREGALPLVGSDAQAPAAGTGAGVPRKRSAPKANR